MTVDLLNERVAYLEAKLKEAQAPQPSIPAPPECVTDAEKKAYAFGWWKALEVNRAQPAPSGDAKDAQRWRMAVLIGNEVMLHPDKRTNTAAVKAYMDATGTGADLTGAVDAAIDAARKEGNTP